MAQTREVPANGLGSLAELQAYEATPIRERFPWQTSYQLIEQAAQRYGAEPCLKQLLHGGRDEQPLTISYAGLFQRVNQSARLLQDLGVTATSPVAILLPILPQTHFAIWGAQAVGISNPINPLLDAGHIAEILNESKAAHLIAIGPALAPDLWQKVCEVARRCPQLTHILCVNSISASAPEAPPAAELTPALEAIRVVDFDSAIAAQSPAPLPAQQAPGGDRVAAYFHTGGTTGRPKIARLTHHNMAVIVQTYSYLSQHKGRFHIPLGLPMFHIYGTVIMGLGCIYDGRCAVLLTPSGFRNPQVIENFWHHISRFQAPVFAAVPTLLARLLEVPCHDDITCLTDVSSGASPLAPSLKRKFEQRFDVVITEGYGMTETAGLISRCLAELPAPTGSVGLRIPYLTLQVAHLEGNRISHRCAPGETGTVLVKGPGVFAGYLNAADNAGAWVDSKWFNTGDLGYQDQQGYVFLTGRAKDLIIRGGHNIDPQLIEEPLGSHADVLDCVAVAQPDRYAGEVPVAYVTLRAGATADIEELLDHCSARISERAAVPKRIEVLDTIPLTAVGKVFKPPLREKAAHWALAEALEGRVEAADIRVETDKKRGLTATITVPEDQSEAELREQLTGFSVSVLWQ
ncbi:acyl-CoA synthetase [Exilibacterium tricleocarpae]|uniref:Acyl-CoA synthetase n=1 Tax=Exilibacterium tricleocarpae TaxID=2591008 RepID=A0A545TLW2_9GAMM|nr:acyl-CoA synthetase [Exilibacterium tricleocarpae]TQV78141.1 acyl-CoA synthetase [Exilibacterium tricleocarpae]